MSVTVHHGDCRDVLAGMEPESVDAVVTDPPYELGFMGHKWDASGVAYDVATWAAVLRVLKPGGHVVAFGGTRTWHRMVVAIEDAGFEIRDELVWLYGSGFPKSLDVSKAIDKAAGAEREVIGSEPDRWTGRGAAYRFATDRPQDVVAVTGDLATPEAERWEGWGTALKPAHEPICLARKPLVGTVAGNVLAYGTGALNIDGCRIGTQGEVLAAPKSDPANRRGVVGGAMQAHSDAERNQAAQAASIERTNTLGRWPANVVLDEEAAAMLDEQSGERPGMAVATLRRGASTGRSIGGDSAYGSAGPHEGESGFGDTGGASRFFYVAKAAKHERPVVNGIAHPTVKPVALMRWLVRLVTPPDGIVLDPFAGTGTTAEAAAIEGHDCVLIEADADHLPLIESRLAREVQPVLDLGGAS